MNKYSIIIPIYNCEKYIIDCLNSIYIQDNNNYEVIIIDDGSTDNSNAIIKEFIRDKKNYHLYTNKNHGVSYSRNFGINKSKNDFIIFLDSDDILANNALSVFDDILDKYPDVDLIQCGYQEFNNEIPKLNLDNDYTILFSKKEIEQLEIKLIADIKINLKQSIIPAPFCKVYKRENIIKNKINFNENFSLFEDGIFNFEYLFTCKKICFNNQNVYYYRVFDGDSLSKKSDSSLIEQKIKQCKYIKEIIKNKNMDSLYYNMFIFGSISSVLNRYVYNSKNSFSLKEKKKLVKDILTKEEFNEIKNIKIFKYLSMKKKILYLCIKYKLYLLLNVLYSIKEH